ncbi:hypothetical protein XNW1_2720005 [Xenorhabdus nematophila str. Websteri]|nr:hypothetical protein XNW1_2720005 [Xenorhabdus nematophila str. Websteri]
MILLCIIRVFVIPHGHYISALMCCSHPKKLRPRWVTTLPLDNLEIQLICEVDEMWSFVSNKKQQRWL